MSEIQKQTSHEQFTSPEAIKSREAFEYNLKFRKAQEKFPNLKRTQVSEKVFSMSTYGTNEIDLFLTPSALPYYNVEEVRKEMISKKVYESIFALAGLEEKLENGVHVMMDTKTGKQINPHSKEYFEAWQEVMFYEVYRFINNSSVKELKRSLYESDSILNIGRNDIRSIRLKHNIEFLKKMNWNIITIVKKN